MQQHPITDTFTDRVIVLIRKDAENRRMIAGYSGGSDDGGASRLEDQIKFFLAGWNKKAPPEWEKYRIQANNEADSEYQNYLRLKNKFEK